MYQHQLKPEDGTPKREEEPSILKGPRTKVAVAEHKYILAPLSKDIQVLKGKKIRVKNL